MKLLWMLASKCSASLVTLAGTVSHLNFPHTTLLMVFKRWTISFYPTKSPFVFGNLPVTQRICQINPISEDFCYQKCCSVELRNRLSCVRSGPWSLWLELPLIHILLLCRPPVGEIKTFIWNPLKDLWRSPDPRLVSTAVMSPWSLTARVRGSILSRMRRLTCFQSCSIVQYLVQD